jgi:reactive chlorine resistance protein C
MEVLMHSSTLGSRLEHTGTAMLRYGLVAILLLIGLMKWTTAEAEAIRPWVANSPFLSWLYSVTSVQGGSIVIGCIELVTALLIAVRRWFPRATVVGSALAAGMFVVTISFLFTTPNQSPDAQGFLMKDFFLLATAIWSAGEALRASRAEGS